MPFVIERDPVRPHLLYQSCPAFLSICLFYFLAYTVNGRYIGAGDCVPAMFIPVAIARGDGPWLDRYESFLKSDLGQLPGYCELSRGHVVSRYPIGPALVLSPFVIPQVIFWDQLQPGWDQNPEQLQMIAKRIIKTSAAMVCSIAMGLLWLWLKLMLNVRYAFLLSLTTGLGSGVWSTASQAGWQHGPALFCLMMSVILMSFWGNCVWVACFSGFFAGMIVVCRTVDLPIALSLWVASLFLDKSQRRGFSLAAGLTALIWAGWNIYFFDHLTGGYSEIEKMHGWAHGVKGSWSTPVWTGLAGTLFSPSHGLLVYSPWVLFSMMGMVGILKSRHDFRLRLLQCLSLSLPFTLLLYSKYSCWWAGHCFGARFWIDSSPILTALGGMAFHNIWIESKLSSSYQKRFLPFGGVVFMLFTLWAILLQSVAVWTYPTTWHSVPTNVDRDHQRLWDWKDNEVTRGLKERPHPRQWPGL